MAGQTILITASSGNIGEELVPQLLALQPTPKLVLPTSQASRLRTKVPASADANVAIEEGTITDPNWFQSVLEKHKVDTVMLCLTGPDELFITLNCLDAMHRSPSVKKLIYISAAGDFTSPEGLKRVTGECRCGHVLVKPIIELALQNTDNPFEYTVLGPTLFFTNDLRSKDALLRDAHFDEPLGEQGVSRVTPYDIALAVKNVALDKTSRWNGKKIPIGSKQAYTASQIGKIWSKALGKEITMLPSDSKGLASLEQKSAKSMGVAWGRDHRLMYDWFAEHVFEIDEEGYRLQVELIGKDAEDYEAWVLKTAASWQ